MDTLRFNVIDIFRSNRLALSIQRIWIQFIGLTIGYIGYFLFTLVSLSLAGLSFNQSFSQFGLFPCLFAVETPLGVLPKIVFMLGCIFFVIVFLLTNTAVSRAAYMVLKGNNFYSWHEAVMFALKKSSATIMTPLAIGLLILSFVVGAWLVGLIGRIPFVGTLGVSFLTIVWMLASLFVVYLVLVTAVSLILTPAILATTDEDTFEAVFQSFSTAWSQPWRIIIYEGLASILSISGFLVLAIIVKSAFVLMNDLFSFSMTNDYINMAVQAQYFLQSWTLKLEPLINQAFGFLKPYIYFTRDFIPLELSFTVNISAYILAINMVIVAGIVLSYLFATFNSGNTITYLVLRKIKDDENLLERQDEIEEENSDETETIETEKEFKDITNSDEAK